MENCEVTAWGQKQDRPGTQMVETFTFSLLCCKVAVILPKLQLCELKVLCYLEASDIGI